MSCFVLPWYQHIRKEEVKLGRHRAEFYAISLKDTTEPRGNSKSDRPFTVALSCGKKTFPSLDFGCEAWTLARTVLSRRDKHCGRVDRQLKAV